MPAWIFYPLVALALVGVMALAAGASYLVVRDMDSAEDE